MEGLVRYLRRYGVLLMAGLVLLVCGVALGWYGRPYLAPPVITSIRESTGHDLIAPFLYLSTPESTQLQFLKLKGDIAGMVANSIERGRASDISVYLRDMNSGQWIAVNREHKFALASMLKVVTLITILHQAEQNPGSLASHITIAPSARVQFAAQAYYPPEHPVQLGKSYSIEEMLSHQIVESDNTAEDALEAYIGRKAIQETYDDLRLPMPPSTTVDADTAQEYSHLFRVLYGATYLSQENSQAALDLLTRTTFKAGLVAGVPEGTRVAHKFGKNLVPVSSSTPQIVASELHDCGIIYAPGHPYFLCVTTKGDNFDTLAGVIKDISALSWKGMGEIQKN